MLFFSHDFLTLILRRSGLFENWVHSYVWGIVLAVLSSLAQSGAWALQTSLTRPSFFVYFQEFRKKRKHKCGPGPGHKQWILDGHVKIYNSVSARLPLTKSKIKNERESSNIKALRRLSATQNGLGVAESFSTLLESKPSRLTLCDSP